MIRSRWNRPMFTLLLMATQIHAQGATMREASVYHSMYDGRRTACGQVYDHWGKATAAANDFKCGTRLKLTYEGKSLIVTVNDTGSDPKLNGRRIDLSGKAMKHFRPHWDGTNKAAPLIKRIEVEALL